MAEHMWTINRTVEALGVDSLWPITNSALGAAGSDVGGDVTSIRSRCKKYADVSREFARVAAKREAMAKKAEGEGHIVTARDNFHSAAVFWGFAEWAIHEDDNEDNIAYEAKKIECCDRYIKHAPHPMERVEIPFEGKALSALLHLPPNSTSKVPCVLSITGMDGFKEMMHPAYGDKLIERGMAVLALDGPGQGESIMRKIRCTADNFGRAGQAAMDFLIKRPEIDADRIAVSGVSMGSFWATQIAAYDSRFKAGVVYMVCHEPGMNTIFNVAYPVLKNRYMWMAGYENEDEFDKFAQTLTLKGAGSKIKCPFMIIAGEDEELSPIKNSYNLYDEIVGPKKIIVFEGQGHDFIHFSDVKARVADWLKDRLEGKPMQSERIYVDMTEREIKDDGHG
jgi:dipeptidyl aminopeptidase/acylaminoacyl peptidase